VDTLLKQQGGGLVLVAAIAHLKIITREREKIIAGRMHIFFVANDH
jgi:hypothetical protein